MALGAVTAVLVLAAVLLGSGGGGSNTPTLPQGEIAANQQPTTPTTPTTQTTETGEASTTPTTVESSQVETVLKNYEQDYANEDLEALKGLFAESLTRKDGTSAPEDLSHALATYEHQFSKLKSPSYTLSELNVQPAAGEANASAHYSISSQNGTVKGSISFHLVEQSEQLLIDKITVEPSK